MDTVFDWVNQGRGVILANSTCFSKDMFSKLALVASNTNEENIIITFSNGLEDDIKINDRHFDLLRAERLQMSWGEADVFYHKIRKQEML